MTRCLAGISLCAALAGCAGNSAKAERVVHDRGICMHVARESTDLLAMQLCNCSGRTIRLDTDGIPWEPLARSSFEMMFNGEPVQTREIGLIDPTPYSFCQIPDGECLDGKIDLLRIFVIEHALDSRGWELRWNGTIFGDEESWTLDFRYDF
jgi:hypothetical protein